MDWLDGYLRLVEWAGHVTLVEADLLKALQQKAAAAPALASGALTRARALREAIYTVVTALIRGDAVECVALDTIHKAWKRAKGRTCLEVKGSGIHVSLDPQCCGLDLISDALALAAIDLLTHYPEGRTRLCPGEHCGWVFIDTSKGGHRVWCDMRTCGNVAKARRHYHAKKRF
jgi:predicted RNA-binding Zn ribbon-like protein